MFGCFDASAVGRQAVRLAGLLALGLDLLVAPLHLACFERVGYGCVIYPTLIEFGKDSLIHLAVEQVCKNLVIYPFDELFLFGLVEPMFGEERIYVGFARLLPFCMRHNRAHLLERPIPTDRTVGQ